MIEDDPDTTKFESPVDLDDEEEIDESDEDLLRIPRSGKRQLMPIERL